MIVRNYHFTDYDAVKALYLQSDLYGGQFDEARDSRDKLEKITHLDPQSILVCEDNGTIVGTVSLIDDGRVAMLFRFAVMQLVNEQAIVTSLHETACNILASRGHTEILVYSPFDNDRLAQRYHHLGLNQGGTYSCFWQGINKNE